MYDPVRLDVYKDLETAMDNVFKINKAHIHNKLVELDNGIAVYVKRKDLDKAKHAIKTKKHNKII